MGAPVISNFLYNHNPFYIDNGAAFPMSFKVTLDPVPENFTWTVTIRDRNSAAVRTISQTQPTGGQSQITVNTSWDGKNQSGQQVPYGGYGPEIMVQGSSSTLIECSGIQAVPRRKCCCCTCEGEIICITVIGDAPCPPGYDC